jgi:hypothetical protein
VSQVIARLLVRVAATSAYQPLVAVHLHGISYPAVAESLCNLSILLFFGY